MKVNILVDARRLEEADALDVTLRLEEVRFDTSLDWILRLAGLRHAVMDGAIFVSTKQGIEESRLTAPVVCDPAAWKTLETQLEQTVTVDFLVTPLDDAVAWLAAEGGVTIRVDGTVVAKPAETWVTFHLDDVPLKQAIAWLCRLNGLAYTVRDGEIFISTEDKLLQSGAE